MDDSKQQPCLLTRCADIVLVLDTPKGRGVFASAPIARGTVLETCPVLVLSDEDNKQHIEKTELFHYTYNWPTTAADGTPQLSQAVVLGLGSMFNHSLENQNVAWKRDLDKLLIQYHALRDIAAGEELCISYGSHLTFVDVDAPAPPDEGDGTDMLNSIDLG